MTDERNPSVPPTSGRRPPAQAPQQFPVDTSQLSTLYTNYCRVTGTPEELVLDLGLNTQMTAAAGGEAVHLMHRVVVNFYTAKRLLGALHMAVQQHEGAYGAIEVDIQKRVRQNQGQPSWR